MHSVNCNSVLELEYSYNFFNLPWLTVILLLITSLASKILAWNALINEGKVFAILFFAWNFPPSDVLTCLLC